MFATPVVIVSNWVKLRPFKGRSLTSLVVTTVPSSELEVCNAAAVAVTVMLLVAIWLTCSVTAGCDTAANPVADACIV